ncbi:hypothetical protein F8388_024924 [Cannabis sativa]|uniref:Endonuclease/exonuclease/phosphatase domain-containing protein n=1 Tax=Cannabis sativa TaxID=3483 RepID=A0A7J6GAA7_CANSA|nr:hypothetical protein F8388_024924 [Cannabis sativa]
MVWNFTGVYGDPVRSQRHHFLAMLHRIRDETHGPWLIGGDFNEVLHAKEKQGGREKNLNSMDGIRKVVEECDFEDLTNDIDTFTWCNGQKENFMLEKLDRCLATLDWVNLFPQSRAFYLEWWCSDHKALVLDTEGGQDSNEEGKALRSRFHFEEAWVEEEECSDIVREGWNTGAPCSSDWDFKSKTQRCGSRLNSWNRKKKKELKHRVKEDDAELIMSIQQGSSQSEDRLIWHFAKNGEYNV